MYKIHFLLPFHWIKSASGSKSIINAIRQQTSELTADGIFLQFFQIGSLCHIQQTIQILLQIFLHHIPSGCHQSVRKIFRIFRFQSINFFQVKQYLFLLFFL